MSSIKKRPNGAWRARYRDDAGKEHARHFDRRVDAQRWLDEQTAAIVTGQYVHPKAGRVTVREYAVLWERSQVGRTRTLEIRDSHCGCISCRAAATCRCPRCPVATCRV
jgi:hypothetical protein